MTNALPTSGIVRISRPAAVASPMSPESSRAMSTAPLCSWVSRAAESGTSLSTTLSNFGAL